MKIAIIGGGASGCICALRIKDLKPKYEVTIFEKENKILKKVAMTGAGRCNISNTDIHSSYYSNPKLIDELLEDDLESHVLDYLEGYGLLTMVEENRIYPLSNQASTVCAIISNQLFYKHVKVNLNIEVKKVNKVDAGYEISGEVFDKVIYAIGSNAGTKYDLSHYQLVANKALVNLNPGLVGLKVKEDLSEIAGCKIEGKVILGHHAESGEILIKKDGISGVCVLNISNYYEAPSTIVVDMLEALTPEDIIEFVLGQIRHDENVKLHNIFMGAVNSKIVNYINKKYPNSRIAEIDNETFMNYILEFKAFTLHVVGTYPVDTAQIIKGGISLTEVDHFCDKSDPNSYYIGEVLDECGICGGYNLWFAFTSGLAVAEDLCK